VRVAHRLFLAVLPAVLGTLLVGALAYWGAYHRSVPGWVLAVSGVAALLSLLLAWRNTRYVARRIESLVGTRGMALLERPSRAPDELDSLEATVTHLSSAVEVAAADRRRERELAAERAREYATLLAETSADVSRQLDEVRLPLQILLDNHFGTLNENQEEMLGAARQAADAASLELGRLEQLGRLDAGTLQLRRDPVRLADLLDGLAPVLRAEGSRRGVEVELEVAPGLPRVAADRARLREAFDLLLRHVVRHAEPAARVRIAAEREGAGGVAITVDHGTTLPWGPEVALARRVLEAQGGTVELTPERATLRLSAGG
jgi:signal transduction histidine kinase